MSENPLTADPSPHKGLVPTVSEWNLRSEAPTLSNVHLIRYSSKYLNMKYCDIFFTVESDLDENSGRLWSIPLPLVWTLATSTHKDKN